MALLLFLGTTFQSPPKSTGAVNAGGKLYFYEPGTTTKKNAYTTSGLSVATANPLILDSNGRGTAWLNGSYKIRVTDSAENLIDEEDNYNKGATFDVRTLTGNETLVSVDDTVEFHCNGTFTVTLTAALSLGAGWNVRIKNIGAGTITVARAAAGDTIDGSASNFTLSAGQPVEITCNFSANGFETTRPVTQVAETVAGNKTFSGTVTASSTLAVTGAATLSSTLAVSGQSTLGAMVITSGGSMTAGAVPTSLLTGTVTQAQIGSNAVGQAQIKTSANTGSTGVGPTASANHILVGGSYSWWTASSASTPIQFGNGDTAAGVIGLYNENGTISGTFHVDERYITASPPYNLGDGDIPLFVFVMFDKLGNIFGTSIGPDPTWAYNGPTDIRPGKRLIRPCTYQEALKDPAKMEAYLDAMDNPKYIYLNKEDITHEIKNKDMGLFPHPWALNDLRDRFVFMVDPMSNFCSRLCSMHESGENLTKLIYDGYIKLSNTPLARKAPPGVIPVAAKFK